MPSSVYTRLLWRQAGHQDLDGGWTYIALPSDTIVVVRNIDCYATSLGVGDSTFRLIDPAYSNATVVWLQWSGVGPSGRGWEGRQVFFGNSGLGVAVDNATVDVSITGYVFAYTPTP